MNENFPNREAVIVRDQELHVVRRLPQNAEIKVRPGERISSDHVIAKTDPRHLAVRISIADQLGVPPNEVGKYMLRGVGSTFAAGEAIAKARKGLRNTVVASPMTGTLLSIDTDTGIGMLAPGAGGDVRSMVSGDVEYVDGRQTVAIRTVGSRLFGIVGFGPSAVGTLRFAVSAPREEAQIEKITGDMAGAIVVVGASLSTATLRRLMDVGATGVISGGLVERDISACFGGLTDDRLSPWRLNPTDTGVGDSMRTSLAIVAIEGFGVLPINADAFSFLKQLEGQRVSLITTTRVSGFLARPQILHVNENALDEEAPSQPIALTEETRLRLTDPAHLGMTGTVAERPRRVRRGDGIAVDQMVVNCADGKARTVALNNVEVIA
jgi:hypothetical protein